MPGFGLRMWRAGASLRSPPGTLGAPIPPVAARASTIGARLRSAGGLTDFVAVVGRGRTRSPSATKSSISADRLAGPPRGRSPRRRIGRLASPLSAVGFQRRQEGLTKAAGAAPALLRQMHGPFPQVAPPHPDQIAGDEVAGAAMFRDLRPHRRPLRVLSNRTAVAARASSGCRSNMMSPRGIGGTARGRTATLQNIKGTVIRIGMGVKPLSRCVRGRVRGRYRLPPNSGCSTRSPV